MWNCFSRCMSSFILLALGFTTAFIVLALIAMAFTGTLNPVTLLVVLGVAGVAFIGLLLLFAGLCFAECRGQAQQNDNPAVAPIIDIRPVVGVISGVAIYGISWVLYVQPLLKIG